MPTSRQRQVRVSSDHRDLAADVLAITNRVAAVERDLTALRDLQARAIALAASRGVAQRVLAEIAGVSGPRISQIVGGQPVDIDRATLQDEWSTWQGPSGDRVRAGPGTLEDQARAAAFTAYVEQRRAD